ncbi:RNA pseudouridylate synthase domain-containing protein 2 [Trichonephila clavata]|uniref:Pseudouridine synthase n=1 Tax=Trichonephila clavata TaxID=2740835 RepID=A0A8X6L8U0_TRICU|nr:RNA pseudouridylate synthase domain-containing protein 2 [Trichonephila clavata]
MISELKITSVALCSSIYLRRSYCSSISSKIKDCYSNIKENNFDVAELKENYKCLAESFNNIETNPYYVENGLRKVYPYYYRHTTYCKGRWIKKPLIDVYTQEFSLYPREEIEKRILTGVLRVNGEIVNLNYVLKNSDVMTASVHRHELPVWACSMKVIFEDDDVLVVDKPSSIPVHPCGLYRYNSAAFILEYEGKWKDLHVTHRLDRLTSGVLIFAKSSEKSNEIHENLILRNVEKEYLCRVEGEFPDGVIMCNKPLKKIYSKIGIALVDPLGKIAVTEFQKLSYNGKSSVVRCKPYTGRTHQIRAHLQYLGYPIVNDVLYNSYVFGPEKGKHGVLHKDIGQLLVDLVKEHSVNWWLGKLEESKVTDSVVDTNIKKMISSINCYSLDEKLLGDSYKKDSSKLTSEKNCYFCKNVFCDPKPSNMFMFLHAHKYKTSKWEYQTEIPVWASDDWNIM